MTNDGRTKFPAKTPRISRKTIAMGSDLASAHIQSAILNPFFASDLTEQGGKTLKVEPEKQH